MAASAILSFLRRQLLPVHEMQEFAASGDSKPMAGEKLDIQACRFQAAAAALAEMQIHARKAQKRNVVCGARQAVEFVARNLLPLDGQIVQEGVLLGFLDRHTQQQNESMSADGDSDARRPGQGVACLWGAARQTPHNGTSSLQCGDGSSSCRKRSHDGMHLDPAFEQAFKRQCLLPPTPPRCSR